MSSGRYRKNRYDNVRRIRTIKCELPDQDVKSPFRTVVKDMVNLLHDGKALDDWISWLKKLTSNFMLKVGSIVSVLPSTMMFQFIYNIYQTMDAGRFVHHARQIILKWNHYGSAIQKDFSLRSAVSLGMQQSMFNLQ